MPETGNKVLIDSAKSILVPAELLAGEIGAGVDLLAFGGMRPEPGQRVVVSEELRVPGFKGALVAVMAVGAEVAVAQRLTSPLLEMISYAAGRAKKKSVNIWVGDAAVYVVVWDKELRTAEAFPDNTDEAILYYMQVIGRTHELKRFEIRVFGERAGALAELLRGYFRKVLVP